MPDGNLLVLDCEDRFWSKADVRGPDDCWLWQAGRHGKNYGQFWVEGVRHGAHRIAWRISCGEIPDGFFVCHRCDVALCVNPNHLFLGTPKDNADDMMAKGRHVAPPGEDSGAAKLTETAVREIRLLHANGCASKISLSKIYGVSWTAIDVAIRRKTWWCVPDIDVRGLV